MDFRVRVSDQDLHDYSIRILPAREIWQLAGFSSVRWDIFDLVQLDQVGKQNERDLQRECAMQIPLHFDRIGRWVIRAS